MWSRIALIAASATPILHCVVLFLSDQNAVTVPISSLSRADCGELHTLGVVVFGIAHVALAIDLAGRDTGRLWPYGRLLLAASGTLLFYVAFYFATASPDRLQGADANDPLWVVATLIGLAMGALQPGLSRLSRAAGLFSATCLGLWLWLALLAFFVDTGWIGLYERLVGSVYVIWIIGVAAVLNEREPAGRLRS